MVYEFCQFLFLQDEYPSVDNFHSQGLCKSCSYPFHCYLFPVISLNAIEHINSPVRFPIAYDQPSVWKPVHSSDLWLKAFWPCGEDVIAWMDISQKASISRYCLFQFRVYWMLHDYSLFLIVCFHDAAFGNKKVSFWNCDKNFRPWLFPFKQKSFPTSVFKIFNKQFMHST